MKVLLLNGSPNKNGETYKALSIIEESLKEKGIDSEWFWLGTKPVRGCIACGSCSNTNRCVFNDDIANELIEKNNRVRWVDSWNPCLFFRSKWCFNSSFR